MNRRTTGMALMACAAMTALGCAGNPTECRTSGYCPQTAGRADCAAPCPNPAAACVQVVPTTGAVAPATARAMRDALMDERRARAFYDAVLERHGQVRPFANIVRAEERHESMIAAAMRRHELDVPSDRPTAADLPPIPGTVRECGALAARLERENIALYDRLLTEVTEPDIRAMFENLQRASRVNHLPALERTAAAAGSPSRPYNGVAPNRPYGAGNGQGYGYGRNAR